MDVQLRKLRKLLRNPSLYLRDYLLHRHPLVLNEVGCSVAEEQILIRHEAKLRQPLANSLEVDVVYTWVDDADPVWQQRLKKTKTKYSNAQVGQYADDAARFANHDELKYSLESVRRFMPWVRKIYIVTDGQRPSWLEDDLRIQIVDHQEIIDPEFLPTFNSHVIEACLHRIPGLSEHFIYFNDDVFAARDLPKNHFFCGNGLASLFLTQKSLRVMHDKGVTTPTLGASLQSARLLKTAYGSSVDTPLVHTYIPLLKSTFVRVWERHEHEIHRFMHNRFRGNEDLNLATFLVPWTAYFEGAAVPATDICYYFNQRSPAAQTHWKQLMAQKKEAAPHSFCANDFNDNHATGVRDALHARLSTYFKKS